MELQPMVWAWPIWVYLFVAGVAGGGFFASFLAHQFSGGRFKHLLKISAWIGVPLVAVGVILLIVDLGNQLFFWHLMVRFLPVSAMSIGTWLLTIWAILAVVLIILWLAEDEVPVFRIVRFLVPLAKPLAWINLVVSALLITYTGVLLSATSRELWSTVLLPVLFVISAISTGLAATLLVTVLLKKEVPAKLGQAAAVLEVYEVIALIAFLIAVPAGVLISGPLSLWFWIGVIVIGMLVPFVLEVVTWRTSPTILVITMAVCVLIGGIVLRAVIVVGGQI